MIHQILYFSLLLLQISLRIAGEKLRKIQVSYPVELMHPVHGKSFTANVTKNRLSCFGNRDYQNPSFKDAIFCFLQLYLPMIKYNCDNIFASRRIEIESNGSIEILRVKKLPEESDFNEHIALNATRWLEITNTGGYSNNDNFTIKKEVKLVPAEPIYLCVRSNDWTSSDNDYSSFNINFDTAILRENDQVFCRSKAIRHLILIVMLGSIWLLPYLVSTIVVFIIVTYGMKHYLPTFIFSSFIVCFAPLYVTRSNRQLARLYLSYFYPQVQATEAKNLIREKMPFFQAIFFSSLLFFVGSILSYLCFKYVGLGRESRNKALLLLLCVSTVWFVFFLVRSFQRFVRAWLWVFLSVLLTDFLSKYVNPMSKDEIVVSVIIVTFFFTRLVRSILRFAKKRKITTRAMDCYTCYIPPLSLPLFLDYIFELVQFYSKKQVYTVQVNNRANLTNEANACNANKTMHDMGTMFTGTILYDTKELVQQSDEFLMSTNRTSSRCSNTVSSTFSNGSLHSSGNIFNSGETSDRSFDAANGEFSCLTQDNDISSHINSEIEDDDLLNIEELFVDTLELNSSKVGVGVHINFDIKERSRGNSMNDTVHNDFLSTLQNSVVMPFFEGEDDDEFDQTMISNKGNDGLEINEDNEFRNKDDAHVNVDDIIIRNKVSDVKAEISDHQSLLTHQSTQSINLSTPFGDVIINKGLVYAPDCANQTEFLKVLELAVEHLHSKICTT